MFFTSGMSEASNIPEMEARVNFMDMLYYLDKRDEKDHPLHGLYTGLSKKYKDFSFLSFPGLGCVIFPGDIACTQD